MSVQKLVSEEISVKTICGVSLSYNVVSCWVTACDSVVAVCRLMAGGLSLAAATGCLMTMLTTTAGSTTYCPEGYCEVGFVWSSDSSGGKCTSEYSNGYSR